MLTVLSDPILPIFMVMVAGFLLRKVGTVDADIAMAINRYVFHLAGPALVFSVVATAPLDRFYWPAILTYLSAELFTYGIVALIVRKVFKRDIGESLLLGMAASFSNHIFFVRPIAVLLYGEAAVFPIAGIVVLDAAVFCGSVFLMELLVAQRGHPMGAVRALARNPFVYAPILGILVWWLGTYAPSGLMTFATFAGGSAAPASLFALGVVLAASPLSRFGPVMALVVAMKLLMHPLLVTLGQSAVGIEGTWSALTLLVAAGPAGAMPFVIATQYGVKTESIAKVILVSTSLSVISLSFLV